MKTPPIIAIVLCGAARFAFAQDAAATAPSAESSKPDCTDCALPASEDAAGGHDVTVFTGVPNRSRRADWSTRARRVYGRLDARSPFGDIEGFTLGRQYNLEYLSLADVGDPFHAGTAGNASNL